MKSVYLEKFLGINRWKSLYQAFNSSSVQEIDKKTSSKTVVSVFLICLIPIISSIYLSPILATIIFGTTCALSIILRNKLDYPQITFYKYLSKDISLTHTAFAFGCIPAAFLLLISPETISEHTQIIGENLRQNKSLGSAPSLIEISTYIIFISIWVAVLEEVVYRGLLLSSLRRWKVLVNNPLRDHISVFISAFVFGFAHYNTWGLFASLSLVGIGIGFGIAYIVCREKLLPLIIYHFLFDLISFSIVALN